MLAQEDSLGSRSIRTSSAHSKTLFGSFSPIKKSELDIRKNEGPEELFCEFCTKLFSLRQFREHINYHRRKPQSKILPLNELYNHIQLKSRVYEPSMLEVTRVESFVVRQPRDYKEVLLDMNSQNLVPSSKTHIVIQPELQIFDGCLQVQPNRRMSMPAKSNPSSDDTSEKISIFYQRENKQGKKNQLGYPAGGSRREADVNAEEFIFSIDKAQKRPPSKGKNLMIHLQHK